VAISPRPGFGAARNGANAWSGLQRRQVRPTRPGGLFLGPGFPASRPGVSPRSRVKQWIVKEVPGGIPEVETAAPRIAILEGAAR